MSEMIERMSMAMAGKAGLVWDLLPDGHDMVCGHGMPEGCKDYWRTLTRTAIEVMREPTEEMTRNAANECSTTDLASPNDFKEHYAGVWDSMIDAVLKPHPRSP